MPFTKKNEHLKRSRLQERKGAAEYGGSQTPASGSGWVKKADVRTLTELIEFKTTTKGSYNLKASELKKLWDQSLIDNRMPVFEVSFDNDGVDCVVLDKFDYMNIRRILLVHGITS